ncbi:MAG: EndoU domain-containing protein [Cytophagales bacterium]
MKTYRNILHIFICLFGFGLFAQNQTILGYKAKKHIFEGEVKNKKGRLQASGCHHHNATDKKTARIVEKTLKENPTTGVYKAKVEIYDFQTKSWIAKVANGGYSTFFPKKWTVQETEKAILEAYKNKTLVSGSSNEYKAYTKEGIEIRMYLRDDGGIISAFPQDWER